MNLVCTKLNATLDGNRWTQIAIHADGDFAGTVEAHHKDKKCAHISKLYVTPKYRKQNIGTLLIRQCEIHARESGCYSIALMVSPGNQEVGAFYRKNGYTLSFEHMDGEQMWHKIL